MKRAKLGFELLLNVLLPSGGRLKSRAGAFADRIMYKEYMES